jgi:phage protein D
MTAGVHSRGGRLRGVALAALVVCSLAAGAVPAAGASSTTVGLSPSNAAVAPGGTTTVDVVVDAASGGVRSYDLSVSVGDASVARVESVTLAGSPQYREVTYAADNSSVDVAAAAADTADAGSVTVATVTLAGVANGTTDVSLSVEALGDEANDAYAVTGTTGATLTVGDGGGSTAGATTVSLTPANATAAPGGTTTVDVVADAASGGVRSYDLSVSVGDASVARVESVTPAGSPRYRNVTYAADNSSVDVAAAAADASATGSVTVATVTLAGVSNGTTDVSLSVEALGDGANDAYAVTGTAGATLAVGSGGGGGSPDAPTASVDAGATTVREWTPAVMGGRRTAPRRRSRRTSRRR